MFRKEVAKALAKHIPLKEKEILAVLEKPRYSNLGDVAFPCFVLSKKLKKKPVEIAHDVADKLYVPPKGIKKVQQLGGYVNFFLDSAILNEKILKQVAKERKKYGSQSIGKGKTALVEHTSVNPNASPHVGRSRNAIIGDFIVRILKFQDYKTEVHYFVNDIGKQIAMLVLGAEGKKKVKFNDLLDIYIAINKRVKEDPGLEKKVFDMLYKLEKGDNKVKKRFRELVNICVKGQEKILKDMGIKYDSFDFESDYIWDKSTDKMLKKLEKTGKLFEDKDRRLVLNQKEYDLAMKSPVLVLTRADKTSVYPLRDIAYTAYKMKKNKSNNYLVLGEDQKLYFQQLAAAMDVLGIPAPKVVHYSFVLLTEGKMSTRKGNVVLLEDLMKEALEKAKAELKKRYNSVDEKRAKDIAYSAIKYSLLRVDQDKNVTFDLTSALSFEGDTGPYLQYAHARIASILDKAEIKHSNPKYELLTEDLEKELIKKIGDFPALIKKATEDLRPNLIANYLYDLAQTFATFYSKCPVLKADKDLQKARLALIASVKQVLHNGMLILGMVPLEVM